MVCLSSKNSDLPIRLVSLAQGCPPPLTLIASRATRSTSATSQMRSFSKTSHHWATETDLQLDGYSIERVRYSAWTLFVALYRHVTDQVDLHCKVDKLHYIGQGMLRN